MFIKNNAGIAGHQRLHTYQEGHLLPILAYDELLFGQRHRGMLRQFFDLSGLSQDEFNSSYGALLNHFIEFAQVIPHKRGGVLGSLLNYGLARATAVMQQYCQHQKAEGTPLLRFAVFSAALLKDLGRVISRQRIVLTEDNGDYREDWNPFSGSMLDQANYFKMYPINANYLRIESESTPLLARQLIPHDSFLWLSNDLAIFSDWLAALLDEEGVGSKQITWALMLIKREDIIAVLSTLDGAEVDQQLSLSTEQGEAFYYWLHEQIESGNMPLNGDAGVHLIGEGIFIENKVFIQFAQLFSLPVNFMIIRTQFGNAMGIIKRSGEDFFHANCFSSSDIMPSYNSTFGAHTQRNRAKEGIIAPAELFPVNPAQEISGQLKAAKKSIPILHQSPQALMAANYRISMGTKK